MAAYEIRQHFKGLRVETGRRKGRDPFATGFSDDDDSEEEKKRSRRRDRSSSIKDKQPPPVPRPQALGPAAKTSILDQLRDSDEDDDFLNAPTQRNDRRPSPAPAQLAKLREADRGVRKGSLERRQQANNKASRSARAQAAGTLAYLDDSDEEDSWLSSPRKADRGPSPAPRKNSDPVDPLERSSTPRGSREPPKEQSPNRLQPSRHTVASAFAGTKYLEDSSDDSDEEAVSSRQGSADNSATSPLDISDTLNPYESALPQHQKHPEVKRVDKAKKQGGSGVSWRAFSASRTEQRNTEIEALKASLKQRGKSISFGTHATTDDGKRVPIPIAEQGLIGVGARRGRGRDRGKSPPRRAIDTEPTIDETEDGEQSRETAGVHDPREYKTNPFTGT